jgi:hypothetical protein
MKRANNKTSTGSASQVTPKKWYNSLLDWMGVWWPALCIFVTLIIAGITKYIFPKQAIFDLMIYLIKSIGVVMVVLYVIYTRLLATETKKMADASMGLYNSEKGTVLTELNEGICSYTDLCEDAKKITRDIHVLDKKILDEEFNELMNQKNLPAIYLKIKNRSGRRIDANKIEYTVRHTGSDKIYEMQCNIRKMGTIGPWEDSDFYLIVSPEGEVEITLISIDYLDGGIVQRKTVIDNKLILDRIRKPERINNG